MSEFRICLKAKGIGNAVRIEKENQFTHVFAGDSDIYAWNFGKDINNIWFEIGHGFGCSDEFDRFLYELTRSLPDTPINYYWHSTMSSMSGSYNIGYMDGKYVTWEDDNVYPYASYTIKHEGIGGILKCGETDAAGFTHVFINDKEFWLNDLDVSDNCIYFNNAQKGRRKHIGIFEAITKAVNDHRITYEWEDYVTGEITIHKGRYYNGKYSEKYIGWR